jgi:hypothetical protein
MAMARNQRPMAARRPAGVGWELDASGKLGQAPLPARLPEQPGLPTTPVNSSSAAGAQVPGHAFMLQWASIYPVS